MPTSTGYEIRSDPSYDWDGKQRGKTPFTVVQHTVAGAGNLQFERRSYRLRPGETMLVIIPHQHRYWVEKGGRWEFFWMSMSGQEAVAIQRKILAAAGPILRLRPETIEHLARCSLRLIKGEGETPGAASAIAYEATMALYDDVLCRHQNGDGLAEDSAIARVVDHIRGNLDRSLHVGHLAERAGLSRAHFTRVFAAREGMPPAEFVMHERMRRAARLLAEASLSVKVIAQACGFEDSNYFAKAFRRMYGINPTEFRTTGMYAAHPRRLPMR